MSDPVWFWQRIVSPHMAGLAAGLAASGREVVYVAERAMSDERAAQGWRPPSLGKASLRLTPAPDAVRDTVRAAPARSLHICQGFRGNGLVGLARRELAARGLRQWVVMETVEDSGWRGLLRRLEYRRLIGQWLSHIEGVLATGYVTPDWLVDRGMPAERVFPFAYFLPDTPGEMAHAYDADMHFRFLFIGQFIERKRVDLLLDALVALTDATFELAIVGSGPLEAALHDAANEKLPGRVCWLGQRPMSEIPVLMAGADCLVLPSRHDGWGAVVSEALMAGTPAVCSDACGVAGVVRASGVGGVFSKGNVEALSSLLQTIVLQGRQTPDQRARIAGWARCLGVNAGAGYLSQILEYEAGTAVPRPPWLAGDKGAK